MKIYLGYAEFGLLFASAILWFISASVRLTSVGYGLEELDKVANLSNDLQKMGNWNFWAAACTGLAVATQIIVRYGWSN